MHAVMDERESETKFSLSLFFLSDISLFFGVAPKQIASILLNTKNEDILVKWMSKYKYTQ